MGLFDLFRKNKGKPAHPADADDGVWLDADTPAGVGGDATEAGSELVSADASDDDSGDDFDFDFD